MAVRSARMSFEPPSYVELVFSLVLVWGFADGLSTLVALSFTGTAALEYNPWIRQLLVHAPLTVLVLKSAVALYVGVVLLELRDFVERTPGWRPWLTGVVALGALTSLGNVYVAMAAVWV